MRYPELSGRVISGEGWGARVGYPTANLDQRRFRHHPIPPGVYVAWATVGRRRYRALAIIGVPYTWRRKGFKVEVHLLDFRGDLRGRRLSATIVRRLRPITSFRNVPAMLRAIANDIRRAERFLR